jgi:hypothetical protein
MDFTEGNISCMAFVTNKNLKLRSMNLSNTAGIVYCKAMHAVAVKYTAENACNLIMVLPLFHI